MFLEWNWTHLVWLLSLALQGLHAKLWVGYHGMPTRANGGHQNNVSLGFTGTIFNRVLRESLPWVIGRTYTDTGVLEGFSFRFFEGFSLSLEGYSDQISEGLFTLLSRRSSNVGDGWVNGRQRCGQWRRATTWATMWAMDNGGGEGPYGPTIVSIIICLRLWIFHLSSR